MSMTNEHFAPAHHRSNLIGAIWMVAAMGIFTCEDALVKAATATMPIGEVMMMFGIGGAIVFGGMALLCGERLFNRDVLSPAMKVRMLFEVSGRLFFILSLALIPLSMATAILQATPLVVVAAAAVVFRETVGWRRWLAIGIGLIGVLVIIKPGPEGFSWPSLLAVIGMVGFAGRDLASRAAPKTIGTNTLGFYGFIAIFIAGVGLTVALNDGFVMPPARSWLLVGFAVAVGVCAYTCLMKAMRTGDVSAVTPFRYTRLLFGLTAGFVFFGEPFTPSMLLGSALIILSGLVIMITPAPRRVRV